MSAPGALWSEAELDHLESLAGDHPSYEVIRKYNRWARANGFPQRTATACFRAGHKRNVGFRPIGSKVTLGLVHALIGCTRHQAISILDCCPIQQKQPQGRRYVARADLRRLARLRPELFANGTRPNLVQLLEDEALVDWIRTHPPIRLGRNRSPVRCLETGAIYPSITKASAQAFVDRNQIYRSIRHGVTAGGFHWKYVHDDSQRQHHHPTGASRDDHPLPPTAPSR
jgi:hypothetical protein